MKKVLIFITVNLVFLSGCKNEGEVDFCRTFKDNYLAQRPPITEISASIDDDTSLVVSIQTPEEALFKDFQLVNFNPAVFTNRSDCKLEDKTLTAEQVHMSYTCNADNGRIKHVAFNLFDQYQSLDEVKVSFMTPAVTKNYLLHRMCPKPLFL